MITVCICLSCLHSISVWLQCLPADICKCTAVLKQIYFYVFPSNMNLVRLGYAGVICFTLCSHLVVGDAVCCTGSVLQSFSLIISQECSVLYFVIENCSSSILDYSFQLYVSSTRNLSWKQAS